MDEARKKAWVTKTITLPVSGMHCVSCALSIEYALSKVEGIKSANVDFDQAWATVEFDPNIATESDFENAIEKSGYKVNYK